MTSKARQGKIGFAYGAKYLIDTKAAIIVDVENQPARDTAEVGAAFAMTERAKKRFDQRAKKLAANAGRWFRRQSRLAG